MASMRFLVGSLALTLCLSGFAPSQGEVAAPTGALSLKDGRFVFGKPIKRQQGGVVVKYEAADVFVPDALITECFSTDADFKFEAKNAKEQKRLDKGLVPFRGRWIKKSEFAREIAKLQEELAERIQRQKAYKLWRNRRKVETKTFKFEHNLPEELFDQLKELMEAYYKTFTKYWKLKTKLPNKPTINLYADRGDFNQISGASGGVVGWYHLLSNQLHIFWDRTDPDFTKDVLFHEANHMLSDMVNGKFRYPHWIEEAMAEYYGASSWDPKTKKISVGGMQPGRLMEVKRGLEAGKPMKLEQLVGSRGYSSYNWGWSFVNFMMETPKYREKWKRYWKALAHGKGVKRGGYGPFRECDPEEQKKQLLKHLKIKDLKPLELEWHAYIKKLKVEDVTGLEQAGRKLRMMGKLDEAQKYLRQAIEKGSTSPHTHAAYADILDHKGKRDLARKMIDKAIELDPLEPDFYYKKGKIAAEGRASDKEAAKKWFRLAAEMDPQNWTYAAAAADV